MRTSRQGTVSHTADLESGFPKHSWIGLEREMKGRRQMPIIGPEVSLPGWDEEEVGEDVERRTILGLLDLVKSSLVNQLRSSS